MIRYSALSSPLSVRDFLLKQAQGGAAPPSAPESAAPPPEDGEQLGLLGLVAISNGFREIALAALHALKELRTPSLRARVFTDVIDAQLAQVMKF